MEDNNKVATAGEDGVSAKQTESQTKPLMITGMDALDHSINDQMCNYMHK